MILAVDLDTYGWITLTIPLHNRAKILATLDVELKSYRTSPQWRKLLGDKVINWLKYIVDPSRYP